MNIIRLVTCFTKVEKYCFLLPWCLSNCIRSIFLISLSLLPSESSLHIIYEKWVFNIYSYLLTRHIINIRWLLLRIIFQAYPEESFPSIRATFEVNKESCIIILMTKKCCDDKRFLIISNRCSKSCRWDTIFSSLFTFSPFSSPELHVKLDII